MKILWVLTSFLLLEHGVTAKQRNKPYDRIHFKIDEIETICTLKGRGDEFLQCMCSDKFSPFQYGTAQCWIFAEITPFEKIWNLFNEQTNLTKLTFLFRPEVLSFSIPTRILKYMRKLEQFAIYFGHIHELPSFAFPFQLEKIIISESRVARIAKHCFYNLPKLKLIQLDKNAICELCRDRFIRLPSLKKLILSKNNISSIQDGTFSHLSNLTELNLDSNSLVTLTNVTFKELGHLKALRLDFNKFESFGDYTFEHLWKLEVLNLDSNNLSCISNKTFAGLIRLEELILSNNQLRSVPAHLIDGLLSIRVLDLRNNLLKTLSQQTVAPILANIQQPNAELFLSGKCYSYKCRNSDLNKITQSVHTYSYVSLSRLNSSN
ncbi:hypothetical protein HHI36_006795 [Cryptolaemus montrouzieri]|uniref:Uncharacterized protein n=1 Tax=Cryptolaemus montrouzieri TaxID=559131 RepID=A0ABD2NY64_9CUCU